VLLCVDGVKRRKGVWKALEESRLALLAFVDHLANLNLLGCFVERPVMDNAAFRAWFEPLMTVFSGFTVTVHDVVESREENKIAIWASSVADSPVGPYHNVRIFSLCQVTTSHFPFFVNVFLTSLISLYSGSRS